MAIETPLDIIITPPAWVFPAHVNLFCPELCIHLSHVADEIDDFV
jgi:hypothetical protein